MDRELWRWIASRNDPKAAALLSAAAAGTSSSSKVIKVPADIDARARTMFALSSTTAELSSLQQQIDSFLVAPAASAKGSAAASDPIAQLTGLFSNAAAQDSQGQLREVDAALSQNFAAWLRQISQLGPRGGSEAAGQGQVWLAAAVAQWCIWQEASSPTAAGMLMGPGALPEQCIR
jgi:hypothetical protein